MRDIIGEEAGRVWKALGKKEEVSLSQLPKMLKSKGEVIYQALGWLAREGKIDYRTKAGKVYVSLSEKELDSFKNSK